MTRIDGRLWALALCGLFACRAPASEAPDATQGEQEASEPGVFVEGEPGQTVPSSRTYPQDPERCGGECPPGGCAGLDCDGDGIGDQFDACPSVPEDRDGFEDQDGCPDADNDQDGVADVEDACPNQPASTQLRPGDSQGCP